MKILTWFGARVISVIFLGCLPTILHAQLPPPDGGWTFPTNLNSWTFTDVTNWTSDNGYPPLSFTNISGLLYEGDISTRYSLQVDTTNTAPALLHYGLTETNGTNLTLNVG